VCWSVWNGQGSFVFDDDLVAGHSSIWRWVTRT
jgi:hypothetical protein